MGLEFGITLNLNTRRAFSSYDAFCDYYNAPHSFFYLENGYYGVDFPDEDPYAEVDYPFEIETCRWKKFYGFFDEVKALLGGNKYITEAATVQSIYDLLYKYTERSYFDLHEKPPYFWGYYDYIDIIYRQLGNLKKLIDLILWFTDEKEGLVIADGTNNAEADIEIYFYYG